MKSFHCDHCDMPVFFENDHCVRCQYELGFNLSTAEMVGVAPSGHTGTSGVVGGPHNSTVRHCLNRTQHQVCNWTLSLADPEPFCVSCRLNVVVPDLAVQGNLDRWRRLELAKRRCVYTVLRLSLPLGASTGSRLPGLSFRFLGDPPNGPVVLTSHDAGVITMNIAEADDDERERRRVSLHEPYRTLVGHFRHEVGHYYWDRLVDKTQHLERFRELFGNETLDYTSALGNYYAQGPPADWNTRCVSAYASVHPWEDWAETWAHYLHSVDTLETAASFGIGLATLQNPSSAISVAAGGAPMGIVPFENLLDRWIPLTLALNAINRGMGLPDVYPFVIPPKAVEKLRFIHELIALSSLQSSSGFHVTSSLTPENSPETQRLIA